MKLFDLKNIKEKLKNFDIFELGNSIVLYYILIYGIMPLAVFLHLPSKYVEYFISENIDILNWRAVIYLTIGLICFIIGYRFFSFKKSVQKEPVFLFLNQEWRPKRVVFVFTLLLIGNLFIKAIRIFEGGYFHLNQNPVFTNNPFYSIIGLLDWLGPIALSIAFIYYFYLLKNSNPRYKIWQIAAWLIFGFEFIYGFFSGSRFRVITLIIIYLIVKHYIYNRNFWRVAVAAILVIFILLPFQNFYKNPEIFFRGYTTIIDHQSKITSKEIKKFVIDNSIGRISQIRIFTEIVSKTNKFLYGETLKKFFISLGPPRFIWKNKPIISPDGNELGRRLGVLSPDDFQTSIAPGPVGDWYINFGLPGIIFGLFFMGIIFRLVYDFFIGRAGVSLSGLMIYSVFWIHFIKGLEDYIAPVWAGLVKIFVILLIIHFFLTKQFFKDLNYENIINRRKF